MSHLPSLRASLVKAAREQREPVADRDPRRLGSPGRMSRRQGLRGRVGESAVLLIGVAVALVIAVLALTASGRQSRDLAAISTAKHGSSPSSPATANPALARGGAVSTVPFKEFSARVMSARLAAMRLLNQLSLPSGAVSSSGDTSVGRRLRAPADELASPELVDVTRFWQLPESPSSVIAMITTNPPRGAKTISTGRTASGSRSHRNSAGVVTSVHGGRIVTQSVTFTLAGDEPVLVSRELAVTVAATANGGTVLRADGEAVWVLPRAPDERIPVGITRVQIMTRDSHTVTTPSRIRTIVDLFNSLPIEQQRFGGCTLARPPFPRYTFSSASGANVVAVVIPACGTIDLTINGVSEAPLSVNIRDRPVSAKRGKLIAALDNGTL